ncbi:Alphaalpha-trehalose-phosphate synthase [UDP-forming] 5 [Zea mays]|uniref:Alphaalpha-trehalose-phosphate synthase [UDP-forming] 5 n=1 Tax=Zea mays TaxID=4577 RepID=K7USG6_MAIZE|nr:Alphaalpha-trehalose-phosphate synthase [UDP-forming] 5 [Zea mays]
MELELAPAPPVNGAGGLTARRIVAAHWLPLRAAEDPDSPFGFAFSIDHEAVAFQLSRGLPMPVTFIGTLPTSVESKVVPSDYLMENFSCLPVYLDDGRHSEFYDDFCKHYLWPLVHYLLPLSPAHDADLRFDTGMYRTFLAVNMQFADRVIEVFSPDDDDLVIVHDYHLWTSDYARHFMTCYSGHLSVSSGARSGHTASITYHGRNVVVKTLSVGLDMVQLRDTLASPEATAKAREIADAYRGQTLIVGVNDVDRFKGVKLKLLAMEKMLESHSDVHEQVVLVQINNPTRSRGRDVDGIRDETHQILQRINMRFARAGTASSGPAPVVMIDGPVPMSEKVAYYAAADCCVVSAVRDGLNRVPYFYTTCREEAPDAQKGSAVVVSEFAGCSPTLGGAIRVDPWDLDGMADAMHATVTTMSTEEKQARHRGNYDYLHANDAVTWAQAFDDALQLACKDHSMMWFVSFRLGMSYRAAAIQPSFRMLATATHLL